MPIHARFVAAADATNESRWRTDRAKVIAKAYAADPKVAAVALGGSVARGWADRYSDVELDVYWHSPPTREDRLTAIESAGGAIHIDWHKAPSNDDLRALVATHGEQLSQLWPLEDDEWSEHFDVDGMSFGISGFLTESVEHWLVDVLQEFDIDETKQMRIGAVQHAVALEGHDQITRWKAKAATFPDGLRYNLLAHHLRPEPRWVEADMLASRAAVLPLLEILCRMERKLLSVLLALNRIHLLDPRHKWATRLVPAMTIKPPGFDQRLQDLPTLTPIGATSEMQKLFDETLELVQREVPKLDTTNAKAWLTRRRPVRSGA